MLIKKNMNYITYKIVSFTSFIIHIKSRSRQKILKYFSAVLFSGLTPPGVADVVNDLWIANGTGYSLTFSVNDMCTNEINPMDRFGLLSIDEQTLMSLCNDASHCKVTAYEGLDCAGELMGGINMDFENHSAYLMSSAKEGIDVNVSVGSVFYLFMTNRTV